MIKKILILTLVILVVGCAQETQSETINWQNIKLKDVNSQETFTISQFEKPILLESFAVWCPTCTRQQNEIKKLHEEDNSFISITLDTDPNEDESLVKEHTDKHGFDWRYVISPRELTQELVNILGINFVNAPSAPIALLCPGKEPTMLNIGFKSKDELKEALSQC
tara:strand:- start:185 stop:682 length:498 start_codon:yes stop_codon:yes gene_type:complete